MIRKGRLRSACQPPGSPVQGARLRRKAGKFLPAQVSRSGEECHWETEADTRGRQTGSRWNPKFRSGCKRNKTAVFPWLSGWVCGVLLFAVFGTTWSRNAARSTRGSLATSGVDAGFLASWSPALLLGYFLFSPFFPHVTDTAPGNIKEEACE